MTTAFQNTIIHIDQNWLDKNQNLNADTSFSGLFSEYTGKAIGALRSLQIIKGIAKLWNEVVPNPPPAVKGLEDGAGAAMSGLGIVRLPSATGDAIGRVVDLTNDTGASLGRKVGLAIKDVGGAVATWIYTGIFLTGEAAFLRIAQFADLAQDGADLAISAADYKKAAECEAASSGEVKEAFTHTKNYNMLRTAKAVISVASAMLAIMMSLSGAMEVSVVALILLSLTSACVATRRDIYKDQGRYQVISFDKAVIV